jgi:3-hydroxyacyl-[acyl-carrier-protein] dehydratase
MLNVLKLLPHRYPFLFVDRVLLLDPGVSGVGVKNVTANEQFFWGWRNKPSAERQTVLEGQLFPGAFMAEALAQMSGVVLRGMPGTSGASLSYLAAIRGFRIRRQAGPGDQLILFAQRGRSYGHLFRFKVRAEVDGAECADGEITLALEKGAAGPASTTAAAS